MEIIKLAINSRKKKSIRKVLDQLEGSSQGQGSDVLDSGPSLSIEEKHQHFQVGEGVNFNSKPFLISGCGLICHNQR